MVRPISGAVWQKCYQDAPDLQVPPLASSPPPDEADRREHARAVSKAAQAWDRRTPSLDVCDWSAQETWRLVQAWSRHTSGSILGNAEEPLRQVLRRLPEVQARICADPESLSEDHPHFRQWMACALITREANMLLIQYDWGDLAHIICTHAMEAWRDGDRYPTSVSHAKDPLCIITTLVLKAMNVTKPLDTVSMVLRGRRQRK
jgi:hypothetical protein